MSLNHKKMSIKENFIQTTKQAFPSSLPGVFIGLFSIVAIYLIGWHEVFKNIISENMAIYTVVLFCASVFILWGIYFLIFFFYSEKYRQLYTYSEKLLRNISRSFVSYTSLTFGTNITMHMWLFICSRVPQWKPKDAVSILIIEKHIYNYSILLAFFLMCFLVFCPYCAYGYLYKEANDLRTNPNVNRAYRRVHKVRNRIGFLSAACFLIAIGLCFLLCSSLLKVS
jgi:hypothetical protein